MTTITELAKRCAEIAYVLEIEGIEYAFTDNDAAGISAAGWAAAGYTVKGGLARPGSTKQQIDILQFKIEPTGINFELVDLDGTLGVLFADSAGVSTYLTAALTQSATSASVKKTDSFDSSGTIYIGHERITYSGTTATSFTGLTRGTLPWGNKDSWAHGFNETETGIGASVTSIPTIWMGRGIMLRIVAKDADTGEWNSRDDSELIYAGMLTDSWQYSRGVYTLSADSVEAKMMGKMFSDQYSAQFGAIQIVSDETLILKETDIDANGHTLAARKSTIVVPAGSYTLSSLVEEINSLFDAARGGLGDPIDHHWSLQIIATGDKQARIRWVCQYAAATIVGTRTTFLLQWAKDSDMGYFGGSSMFRVRNILGGAPYFNQMVGENTSANNYQSVQDFESCPATVWIDSYVKTLTVDDESEVGTWHDQTPADLPRSLWADGARGFVLVGGNTIWAVSYSSGVFTKYAEWNWKLTGDTPEQTTVAANSLDIAHMIPSINKEGWNSKGVQCVKELFSSEIEKIDIKQVWIASGTASSLVLKMLMSTGDYQYNREADMWPASLGAGIPSTLIDWGSFQAVSAASGAASMQKIVLFKESNLATEIQSILGSIGAHLVWSGGLLRAILPTTLESMDADYEIDSYTVGMDDVVCDNATDLIRNTCTLKYNRNPVNDSYMSTPVTYVDRVSVDVYGPKGEIEFEARGIYDSGNGANVKTWLSNVAAPMCLYWSRLMRRYSITGAPGLWGISPGDIVEFTCDDPPDPVTGAYGLDGVRGWVISVSYNHDMQCYDNITIVVPTAPAYMMGPSAKLDKNATNAGYVEDESPSDGHFTLWTELHEFSLSSESIDAKSFAVDDVGCLYEADPQYTEGNLQWIFDITEVCDDGSIRCEYIGSPPPAAALPGFDASKEYYLCLANSSEQWSTQRLLGGTKYCAYIADDDDDQIAGGDPATYYGSFRPRDDEEGTDPDASNGVYRPCDIHYLDGNPFSVQFARDLAETCNAFWQYGQLQQVFGLANANLLPYPYESFGGDFDENTVLLPSTPIRIPWGVDSIKIGLSFSYAGDIPPTIPEEYMMCRVTISPTPGPDSEGVWQGEYSQGVFNVYASDCAETWTSELDGIRSVNGWAWITLEAHCYSEYLWWIHTLYAYANPRELNS